MTRRLSRQTLSLAFKTAFKTTVLLSFACGGTSTPVATPRAEVILPDEPASAPTANVGHGAMGIEGVESSMSEQEARMALAPRMTELGGCFALRSGSLQQLGGRIRLVIRVDGDGRVLSAHPDLSTVGDRDVERCVRRIVGDTRFGGTRGGGVAEVQWSFSVDPPASVREPAVWNPERVARIVRRRSERILRHCNPTSDVHVTAYVSRGGRVLSAGAAAEEAIDESVLDCVATRVKRWRMPATRRVSKVTFSLT